MSTIEPRSAPLPHRMPAIALVGIILIAALVATGAVLAASSGAAPPKRVPAATRVGVTMKEFTVAPRPATGKAGSVTFRVRNAGKVKHEFVVLRTPRSASKLLKGAEASEAGNVGEIGNLPAGSTKSLTLKLKAGHYALICNLPGHYKAGQWANFVVK